ncbi:MAG TPA: FHA domain-containing protein [Chloroflexota bacterium]|nr:FHA domain-containing protein [Chloroflexota bacterium]
MVESKAELHADTAVLPLRATEGQILTVGRRTEHGWQMPDVDLGGLRDGATVSRQHAKVYVREGQWFLRVEDTARNPTLVDGLAVPAGVDTPLSDGSALKLGNVALSFKVADATRAARIELTLDPSRLTLAPGEVTQIIAQIVNRTGYTERFCVSLQGLDPSWYSLVVVAATAEVTSGGGCAEGAVPVRLFSAPTYTAAPPPESMAVIRIAIHPPDHFSTRAGLYPLRLVATSDAPPYVSREAEGQLTVESFAAVAFTLGEERLRGARGMFPVTLQNLGNTEARIDIRGESEDLVFAEPDALPRWPFQRPAPLPPSRAAALGLQLGPGERAERQVLVRARHRQWAGLDRGYNFFLVAKGASLVPLGRSQKVRPDAVEQRLFAQLVCPPRLPQWLQEIGRALHRMSAQVLTLALILGVAYIFLHPPNVQTFTVDKQLISQGSQITISWDVQGASSLSIEPGGITVTPVPPPVAPKTAADKIPVVAQIKQVATGIAAKISKGWQSVFGREIHGSKTLSPSATTTYTLTARRGLPVFPATRTLLVDVQPKPKLASFVVTPSEVSEEGQPVKLTWDWGAVVPSKVKLTALAPDGGIVDEQIYGGAIPLVKTATELPWFGTETFQLQLFGDDPFAPTDSAQVAVTISKPVIGAFTDTVTEAGPNTSVALQWQVQHASSIEIGQSPIDAQHPDQDLSALADPNNQNSFGLTFNAIPPGYDEWDYAANGPTRYVLVARNRGGASFKILQVTSPPALPVKIDLFVASRLPGAPVGVVQLSYAVENARHITINASDGKVLLDRAVNQIPGQPPLQGTVSVPASTGGGTYVLTAVGADPHDFVYAPVVVAPQPAPAASPAAVAATQPSAKPAAAASAPPQAAASASPTAAAH